MKISQRTIGILENFSKINPSIVIHKGSVLRTVTPSFDTFASADVEEIFPQDVGIFNLKGFLSVLSLFDDPDLKFTQNHAVITGNNSTCHFTLGDSRYINGAKNEDPELPPHMSSFILPEQSMKAIFKSASIMLLDTLRIDVSNNIASLKVLDPANMAKHNFSMTSFVSRGVDVTCSVGIGCLSNAITDEYEVGVHTDYISLTSQDSIRYLFPTIEMT